MMSFIIQPSGAATPSLTLLSTLSPSGVNTITTINLASNKVLVVWANVTYSPSDRIIMNLSVDNGVNFGKDFSITHNSATSRGGPIFINNANQNYQKLVTGLVGNTTVLFDFETNATVNAGTIDALRFYSSGLQNYTGGNIFVYGWS